MSFWQKISNGNLVKILAMETISHLPNNYASTQFINDKSDKKSQ